MGVSTRDTPPPVDLPPFLQPERVRERIVERHFIQPPAPRRNTDELPTINITIQRQPEREQNINVNVQSPTSDTRREEIRDVDYPPTPRRARPDQPQIESTDRNKDVPVQPDTVMDDAAEEQKPEVKPASDVEVQPEVKPEITENTSDPISERKPEDKSSKSEEKASEPTSKLKLYNGLGRKHTAAEIDEILDFYILYNQLPSYVSDRQKYAYKHHIKLPERRQLLEQAGLIQTGSSRTKKSR